MDVGKLRLSMLMMQSDGTIATSYRCFVCTSYTTRSIIRNWKKQSIALWFVSPSFFGPNGITNLSNVPIAPGHLICQPLDPRLSVVLIRIGNSLIIFHGRFLSREVAQFT